MFKRISTVTLLMAALAVASCQDASFEDIAPKTEKRLPPKLVESMRARGMSTTSPIMLRIFKEESKLEVWKRKDNGRYDLATSYDICKWSGKLGPKFTEGDRQAPEGFYMVRPQQMNPRSSYHLSFNMGFPNAFDRAHGRSGVHLMVHGACSSAGCYSMTDPQIEQIYAFARDAFKGGQTEFQIQAFPFRMTAENMARYRKDPNYPFWQMLKEGYDHFEITKVPPKVDVCGKRYVFNQITSGGDKMSAAGSCPAMTQPDTIQTAYRSYQATYEKAFSGLVDNAAKDPAPSIAGLKEAALVADWSRRRARGEKVTRDPPSLQSQAPAAVAVAPSPRPAPAATDTSTDDQQSIAAMPETSPLTTGTTPPAANAPAEAASEANSGKRSRFWGMFGR